MKPPSEIGSRHKREGAAYDSYNQYLSTDVAQDPFALIDHANQITKLPSPLHTLAAGWCYIEAAALLRPTGDESAMLELTEKGMGLWRQELQTHGIAPYTPPEQSRNGDSVSAIRTRIALAASFEPLWYLRAFNLEEKIVEKPWSSRITQSLAQLGRLSITAYRQAAPASLREEYKGLLNEVAFHQLIWRQADRDGSTYSEPTSLRLDAPRSISSGKPRIDAIVWDTGEGKPRPAKIVSSHREQLGDVPIISGLKHLGNFAMHGKRKVVDPTQVTRRIDAEATSIQDAQQLNAAYLRVYRKLQGL